MAISLGTSLWLWDTDVAVKAISLALGHWCRCHGYFTGNFHFGSWHWLRCHGYIVGKLTMAFAHWCWCHGYFTENFTMALGHWRRCHGYFTRKFTMTLGHWRRCHGYFTGTYSMALGYRCRWHGCFSTHHGHGTLLLTSWLIFYTLWLWETAIAISSHTVGMGQHSMAMGHCHRYFIPHCGHGTTHYGHGTLPSLFHYTLWSCQLTAIAISLHTMAMEQYHCCCCYFTGNFTIAVGHCHCCHGYFTGNSTIWAHQGNFFFLCGVFRRLSSSVFLGPASQTVRLVCSKDSATMSYIVTFQIAEELSAYERRLVFVCLFFCFVFYYYTQQQQTHKNMH